MNEFGRSNPHVVCTWAGEYERLCIPDTQRHLSQEIARRPCVLYYCGVNQEYLEVDHDCLGIIAGAKRTND